MKTICAMLFLALLVPAWGRTLAVALPPHATIAAELAGPGWNILVALPEGVDHEQYAPTPTQMRALLEADLYWASGMGFERRLLPRWRQLRPSLTVVEPAPEDDAAKPAGERNEIPSFPQPQRGAHDHHHDHDHDCGHGPGGQAGDEHAHQASSGHDHDHDHDDLHRWLDPLLAMADAAQLTEALVRLDPAEAPRYRERWAAFAERCRSLSEELGATLEPFRGEPIFVYHAAFGRFAEAFRIEQVALESGGREPSLRALQHVVEQARQAGARIVYVQPQHQPAAAEALARAIDGTVVSLDPLAGDWEANLRRMARQFAADFASREGS